jgi:hypothetical protein
VHIDWVGLLLAADQTLEVLHIEQRLPFAAAYLCKDGLQALMDGIGIVDGERTGTLARDPLVGRNTPQATFSPGCISRQRIRLH